MRVRNAPGYKKRIVELLEVRKERREKKIREKTQLELFEETQEQEIILPDSVLSKETLDINDEVLGLPSPGLQERKEAEKVAKRDRSRIQAEKRKVRK